MRLKILLAALVVGALGAAVAFAAPQPSNHGRGHTTTSTTTTQHVATTVTTTTTTTITVAAVPTSTGRSHGTRPSATGAGCKPQVTLVVKGTATSDGSASITVTGGNHFAKLLFNNASATLTITTGPNTQVTVNGAASNTGSIHKSDHLLELFRVCKADVTGKSTNLASVSTLSTFVSSVSPKKVVDQTQH